MPYLLSILVIFVEFWGLSGLVLVLHRMSTRWGLSPLLVLLGMLTCTLQYNTLGEFRLPIGGQVFVFPLVSFIVLPALFLSLLVIYVINGTTQARYVFAGILISTLSFAGYQVLQTAGLHANMPSVLSGTSNSRVLLSSMVSLTADMLSLIITYQLLSNLSGHFPSRLAGVAALAVALLVDALLFPLILYMGLPEMTDRLGTHILGKLISVVLMTPMLVFYLRRVAPIFPGTAATTPRPAMDFFSTALQLEARNRQQHSLLRIINLINQLIVRSTDKESLLQEAALLLSDGRSYDMVAMGLTGRNGRLTGLLAAAGSDDRLAETLFQPLDEQAEETSLVGKALRSQHPMIIHDLSRLESQDSWLPVALNGNFQSLGLFPLRQRGEVLGLLAVAVRNKQVFIREESDLIQELADDLAYALDNLESRKQGMLLLASAESTHEGLLVLDLEGSIYYANPVSATMMGLTDQQYRGLRIQDLLKEPEKQKMIEDFLQELRTKGSIHAELANPFSEEPVMFINLSAYVINEAVKHPAYVIISVHDVTLRRQYEHQLLTLNQFVNELVQIHDLKDLMRKLLNAAEEMLQSESSAFYLLDSNSEQVVETFTHNLPAEYVDLISRQYHDLPGGKVLQTLQPFFISNILENNEFGESIHFMADYSIMALLILPVLFQNERIGALTVYYSQPREFHQRDLQMGLTLAHALSIAIKNARLYERLQEYATELLDRVSERTSELQTAKERIEGILASVPDAVFVLDSESHLIHANQAGEALLDNAQSQNLDLFKPNFVEQVARGSLPSEKNLIEVQDKTYQPLASNLSFDHQPAGKILVFRDVTRFRELDRMKTNFVSDVSHELRTPLTNMSIYLDLLTKAEDPLKRQRFLETLRRETNRLTHLIEDLLTISRLEAGRIDMYVKPLDVNLLISDLVRDRTFMANSRGLTLQFEPAPLLPQALADSRLLTQAVSNLLTNAINYTRAGGTICVRTRSETCNEGESLAIDVSDNGVGISPEESGHIFERFYRGSASYLTKATGTGLGLAISKEIVERMDGRITVQSQPEQGSTFTVWLHAVL